MIRGHKFLDKMNCEQVPVQETNPSGVTGSKSTGENIPVQETGGKFVYSVHEPAADKGAEGTDKASQSGIGISTEIFQVDAESQPGIGITPLHSTERSQVDAETQTPLRTPEGCEIVGLDKINKIAEAVFVLKSRNKQGTCFFIDYKDGIYLITACHIFLSKSFDESVGENHKNLEDVHETIRKEVRTAKIIARNKVTNKGVEIVVPEEEAIIPASDIYFYDDVMAVLVGRTPTCCRPIKINSLKDDLIKEGDCLGILHLPNEQIDFNPGFVTKRFETSQGADAIKFLDYYMGTADGSSGAPILMNHCDDGVSKAEYHVVGVHKEAHGEKNCRGLLLSGLLGKIQDKCQENKNIY